MGKLLLLLLLEASFLLYLAGAYDFYVGNRNGWVLKPDEGYNFWSSRRRFLVNDNLVFKYKQGEASVLLVKKEDYDSCNVDDPIKKFEDGNTVFKLDRAGPFFFIDGEADHCLQGQKLHVVVLSVRKPKPAPPPAPSAPPPPPAAASPAPVAKPPTSPPAPPLASPISASPVAEPPTSSATPPLASPISASPVAEPPTSIATPPSLAPAAEPPTSSPSVSPSSSASPTSPSPSAQSPAHSALPANTPSTSPGPSSSSPAGIAVSRFFLGMLALFMCEALLN